MAPLVRASYCCRNAATAASLRPSARIFASKGAKLPGMLDLWLWRRWLFLVVTAAMEQRFLAHVCVDWLRELLLHLASYRGSN